MTQLVRVMTSSVVAAFYESQAQARRIFNALPANGELVGAALIVSGDEGRLRLLSDDPDPQVLQAIFPPSVLALRATGRDADRAQNHFLDKGIRQNLLKEIGENLPPGGAALVAVVHERWLSDFRKTLQSSAGFERYPLESEVAIDTLADQPARD